MDKALKQRLVGALVLIALAVIILPMLLGGQAEQGQEAEKIEIPPRPKELSFETRRFPIGDQPPEQPSQVPASPEEGASLPLPQPSLEDQAAGVASRPDPVTVEVGGERPPDALAGLEPPPALPEVDGSEDASTTQAASTGPAQEPIPAGPAPSEVPASAPQTSPPPAPSQTEPQAEPAAGRYLVQVASFSSTGNANRLAARLREQNLPVLMDTVESAAGTLHRVRVGAYEDRSDAERVLQQLNREFNDLRPRLVDLRPDEEAPVTNPDDPLVRWIVQVGVFSSQDNAERLVFQLRDAGFRASSAAVTSNGTTSYKVRVGPEVDRAAALRLKDRLKAEQGMDGIVQSSE